MSNRKFALVCIRVASMAMVAAIALAACSSSPDTSADHPVTGAAAQLSVLSTVVSKAQGYQYTGQVTTTSGETADLDIQITNSGDGDGTLTAGGQPMKYVAFEGQSYLTGPSAAWRALGVKDAQAQNYDNRPVTVPSGLFPRDPAQILGAARLAQALSAGRSDSGTVAESSEPEVPSGAVVGTPVMIDGHRSTPISVGDMTVYLGDGESDRPGDGGTLDRIDLSPFADAAPVAGPDAGPDAGDASGTVWLSVTVGRMARQAVNDLYGRLSETVPKTVLAAVNPKIKIDAHNVDGPCGRGDCTLEFDIQNTVTDDPDQTISRVRIDYNIVVTANGRPATAGPGCSGTIEMAANSTVRQSCRALFAADDRGGSVRGDLVATGVATPSQAETNRVNQQVIDNRARVTALPDYAPPRVIPTTDSDAPR